jgi:hypothetical protein
MSTGTYQYEIEQFEITHQRVHTAAQRSHYLQSTGRKSGAKSERWNHLAISGSVNSEQ